VDGKTFERNCIQLVGKYGGEIDRALRVEIESQDNRATAMTAKNRSHVEGGGAPLVGLLRDVTGMRQLAGELREARAWLQQARAENAEGDRAVWFVVVHGRAVRNAIVRYDATARAELKQLEEEFLSSSGAAREYIAKNADFTRDLIASLSDAANWLRNLNETEVTRRSAAEAQ
jgi:hypothetical protein